MIMNDDYYDRLYKNLIRFNSLYVFKIIFLFFVFGRYRLDKLKEISIWISAYNFI